MRKTITLFALMFLTLALRLSAQERAITGKVISSDDNLGLPGASVVVQGTTLGTVTDIDGNYKLFVPADAKILRISAVGMKQKDITLGASNVVDVVLSPDVLKLDEVVVTALGIKQEKKRLGYAVQDVSGKDLSKSGENNVVQSLSGKVAGVDIISSSGDPGSSSYISIRGNRAFGATGDNQPLFVIDGIPVDNSTAKSGNPDEGDNNLVLAGVQSSNRMADINPEDIESISVLKGPAASALYGLRAGNGVILITTKKGKATNGRKMNVSYSTSYSIDQVNKLPELQTKYAQGVFGSYRGPETLNRNSWGPSVDTLYWDGSTDYAYDRNGRIIGATEAAGNPNARKFSPYDNREDFFVNGGNWTNNLSISGGNDVSTFYTSASYTKQNGVIPNADFRRTTLRIGGETVLSPKWKLNGTATYSNSGGNRIQSGSNLSGIMLGLLRNPISFDITGGYSDPANTPAAYVLPDGTPRAYRPGIYDSPYWTVNRVPFKDDVNRIISSAQLTFTPFDWLTVFYRPGIDMYSDRRKGGFDLYSGQNPDGQVFEDQYLFKSFTGDLIATANKKLSDDFDGSLVLGNNMFSSYSEQLYTQGNGMVIPSFFQISNTSSVISKDRFTKYRTAAFFANAKLDYKKMLYLDISGRNEWSTLLPDKTYFYPAASLGFIFTEALGMNDNKYLPFGKIRLNWANVGNSAPAYATRNTYNSLSVADGWTVGISSPFQSNLLFQQSKNLANPNLKPTNSTSTEVGLELKFFENRLGVDFTYYNSDTKDGIFSVPVAASSGFSSAIFNAGKINNKGIELQLYGTPIKTKDFSWDIVLNWTRNRSEVVELYGDVKSINLAGFETPSTRLVVGEPYGVIYGGGWLRDTGGNIVIDDQEFNADGTPNSNYGFPLVDPNEKKIGDPNPKWTAGLRNTFTWKNITLTALLDVRHGGDIWNGTEGALVSMGTAKVTETRGEPYVFSGVAGHVDDNGNIVTNGTNSVSVIRDENWYRLGNGSGFGPVAEQFIQDGGWVRLRELGLSYSLSKSIVKKTPFSSIDIGFTGRNLWLKTDYTGVDPETNLTGAGAYRAFGFEYFNNPGTKSYIFSLRVTL